MFTSFVLSATCRAVACGKLCATFNRFVLVQAPLALRNFLCRGFSALCHNKANNFAPGAAPVFESLCFPTGGSMRSIFWIVIFFCLSANVFSDELISVDALNGKIHILAPKGFGPMPQDILAVKYPATQRPTEVLSNDTGSVTLAFNHTNNLMAPSQVREAHAAVSQMFHNMYPSAQWLRDEVIEQNGHTFMVLEVVTPAIDTQIHNIIYGTSVDGRFLIGAFNTTVEQSGEWLPIGRNIMNSIDVD